MKARRSWILSLLVLLAGCAGSGAKNIDRDHQVGAGNGLLVVSVTASGYVPGTLWYQVVRPGAAPVSIPVNDSSFGLDWSGSSAEVKNAGTGRLAVVELPQGSYEMRRWVINDGNRASYASSRPFGYRFSIDPGKATYIGNVHVDIQRSASSALPYVVSLEDKRERDLPLLQKRYAAVKPDAVQVAIASEREAPAAPLAPEKRNQRRMEDLDGLLQGGK